MKELQAFPRRKPLRLPRYDYSLVGPYFVTICTHDKKCLLGNVLAERVRLTAAGEFVRAAWYALPARFPGLVLDAFVIMPNHLHGILAFVGAGLAPPDSLQQENLHPSRHTARRSLPNVIGAFKSISTIQVNRLWNTEGWPLWQRSYYEHVIRNGDDMKNTQRYIMENPQRWLLDPEFRQLPGH